MISETLFISIAVYILILLVVCIKCCDAGMDTRDGFWHSVIWPLWLIALTIYGLYQFLTYLFYLRD